MSIAGWCRSPHWQGLVVAGDAAVPCAATNGSTSCFWTNAGHGTAAFHSGRRSPKPLARPGSFVAHRAEGRSIVTRQQASSLSPPCLPISRGESCVVGVHPHAYWFVNSAFQPTGSPLGAQTSSVFTVSGGNCHLSSRWTRVSRPGSIVTGTSTRR